jgi:deazaflavin-dependent oxidoreductase (nitroreductase family)
MDARTAQRLEKIRSLQTLTLTHHGRKTDKPYDVVIWFVLDGERMFLATSGKNRQWVRNVIAKPNVALNAGGEIFNGTVEQITDETQRENVARLIQAKYWYVLPIILAARMLQSLGIIKDNSAAFEVKFETPA